jgi:polysaccharide deacetylase family protein (PEP-CTERM system associated)
MKNSHRIFTVDVEEYYHAENILSSLPQGKIKSLTDRLNIGLPKILDLLDKSNSKATFFVLGSVAEKNSDLIRKIISSGHEVASHGYRHIPLSEHTPATFEEDLDKSLKILSDISGQKIIGYRATSFSLCDRIPWFFDILRKYGIIYDSSIALSLFRKTSCKVPQNSGYFEISKGLLEFPVSFFNIGPFKIPLGGGYFRAYPYWLTKLGLNQVSQNKKSLCLFYLHPWELDPDQPKFRLSAMRLLRHYLNLHSTEDKLKKLLTDMKFISIKSFLNTII